MKLNVQDNSFQKVVAILFIAIAGLIGIVALLIIVLTKLDVNGAVYGVLGTIVSSAFIFFSKASGVSDGAAIAQNAVATVSGAMQSAILATPGATDPAQQNAPIQSTSERIGTLPSTGNNG